MTEHRSEGERAKWLARWRASGQSCEQFARQHGLSASTLYRWSQRSGRDKTPSFAEVRVVGTVVGASLEVQHPGGCVVRVSGAVDEAQLTAVLRALSSC
jgi:transposase-like protein